MCANKQGSFFIIITIKLAQDTRGVSFVHK